REGGRGRSGQVGWSARAPRVSSLVSISENAMALKAGISSFVVVLVRLTAEKQPGRKEKKKIEAVKRTRSGGSQE
ncbi:hypothetical protein OFC47_27605, partial [Escherichia coli]|nr:hypothetical protein [Escherichia coli]